MSIIDRFASLLRGDRKRFDALVKAMQSDQATLHDKVMKLGQQVCRDLIDGAVADSLIAELDQRNSELRAVDRVLDILDRARAADNSANPAMLRGNWLLRIQSEIDHPVSPKSTFLRRLGDLKWMVESEATSTAPAPVQRDVPIQHG